MKVHRSSQVRKLSANFLSRLLGFTMLAEGWDGESGKAIQASVTSKARKLAFASLSLAPEPFTAPTPDGAVLLKWDLPNGIEVECFVEPESSRPDVAVTENGRVREVTVDGPEAVLKLLETLSERK